MSPQPKLSSKRSKSTRRSTGKPDGVPQNEIDKADKVESGKGGAEKSEPGQAKGGARVAKEDVNVPLPGKKPRQMNAPTGKPQKPAGKRLMDYTG